MAAGNVPQAAPFLIKICGITTPEDAAAAVAAGADAVGVNLWPRSKRYVDDQAAARVLAAVAPGVLKFGVFVNAPVAEVEARMAALNLDRAQLHGDERPSPFARLPAQRLMRVVRVRDASSFAEMAGWHADLFLLDSFVDGYGGAGVAAPWADIARAAPRDRPFLLGGGLDPDNVAAAIAATGPAGVDVASGVERAPGVKDRGRVAAFIAAAREAAARRR
jgi:phosphoribosylanthranilate isomerase